MKFIEENKKLVLSTISPYFVKEFKTCPLKAWNIKRAKKEESEAFLLNGYMNEMISKSLASITKEDYKVDEEPYALYPEIKYEAKLLASRVDLKGLTYNSEVIGYGMMMSEKLTSDMNLMALMDIVLLKDESTNPYIHMIDIKSGFKIDSEVTTSVMITAYILAKKYGLPVLFSYYSARTGKQWEKLFSYNEAISFKDDLEKQAIAIKTVIEDEESPEGKPSTDKCLICPFLENCYAKDLDETNQESLMNKYQLASAMAKYTQEQLKALRNANDKPVEISGYKVDFSESETIAIATPKVTKKDIILLLAKTGNLNTILSDIDIKYTDKVVNAAKELGIDFKKRINRKISIKEVSNEK
jgi:CRISPR/Cas system-associated exonuclease Cas4 (RecB family)